MTNVSDTEKQTKKDNSTIIKSDIEEAINNNESIVSNEATNVVISDSIDPEGEVETASVEESKVMAVSTLLDSKTNISATLAPYGFTFNLANELSVAKNPQSTLAIEGITEDIKGLLKSAKSIAESLKLKIDDLKNVKSPYAFFLSSGGTIDNVKKSVLHNAPQLRLLYKITPIKIKKEGRDNVNSLKFEFNELALVAVDLAVKEFLSSSNLDKITNPKTRHDIASVFGLNEATMTKEQYQELRKFVKQHGIPRTVLGDRIGALVRKRGGLTRNKKTGARGLYERTVSGLGLVALDYMTKLG